MNSQIQSLLRKRLLMPFCLFICMVILYIPAIAQEQPPKPIAIEVNTARNLSFGTFVQSGALGTVVVTHDGLRTATGSIILINSGWVGTPALFEVRALPGTLITIVCPDSFISRSGYSIVLKLLEANTGNSFIATKELTQVYVGGTLIVNSLLSNPAGAYSGTFAVTFIQQ